MTPQQLSTPDLVARPVRLPCIHCGRDLAADLVHQQGDGGPACWGGCTPRRREDRRQWRLWTVLLLAVLLPAVAGATEPRHCYPEGRREASECIGRQGVEACGVYVNVNTATVSELEHLWRVGPALAARIVAGRPYAAPVDVDAVQGIGPATYEAMAPYIVTGKARTTLAVDIVCEPLPAEELETLDAG